MQRRRLVAFLLAAASLALAAAFGVMTWLCGGLEQGESWDAATDETVSYGPRCVPALHPWAPLWAGFAVAGLAGLAARRAWPAIALGAVGLALGVLSGFSAGYYGIGCGALLLAAGLVARRAA